MLRTETIHLHVMTRGETITVHFTGTDLRAEYKVLGVATDGTFAMLEEGPGLSCVIRYNPSERNPTWRMDGRPIEIEPEYCSICGQSPCEAPAGCRAIARQEALEPTEPED